jgi:hypothetical protein
MGLALLGAAPGSASAAAAADANAPTVVTLPSALAQLDRAADLAEAARDDSAFPVLQRALLPPDPAVESRALRLGFQAAGNGLRYRFRDAAPALSLVISSRTLLPAPLPRPGTRRARLLMPIFVQMAFGSWSILGGSLYLTGGGSGMRDSWRSGLAVVRTLTPRLSLGAEFSHDSADLIDGHSNVRIGVGARYRLTGPLSLIVSAGPYFEHHGGSGLKAYSGFSLAF